MLFDMNCNGSMLFEIRSKHFKKKMGAVGPTTVTCDMSTKSALEVQLGYDERTRRYTRDELDAMTRSETAADREYGTNKEIQTTL
jgi:hypothetical protein